MKTKTIKDAYEALKGDLSNTDMFSGNESFIFYHRTDDEFGTSYQEHSHYRAKEERYHVGTVEEFDNYKTVTLPVYTQEMADDGVMPSVGMECCYSSSSMVIWNKCTVIAYYDGFVWTSDNGIRPLANTRFKPLTPPIELIDGKRYEFKSTEYGTGMGYYSFHNNRFISGGFKIQANTCTNIQLLEVTK